MDPLSIAVGAVGLANGCTTVVKAIYTWVDDTIYIDENVRGLCEEVTALSRVLEAVSNASKQAPRLVIAEIDPKGNLWTTVKATLSGIEAVLAKLNQLLVQVQKRTGFFSRRLFRKPAKQIRLARKSKEIAVYRNRVKSYSSAMSTALQMINVCLSIQNNSSHDVVSELLAALSSQVDRVELALHPTHHSTARAPRKNREDDGLQQNVQQFVDMARTFHSSASNVAKGGPRSTVRGNKIAGNPSTAVQRSAPYGGPSATSYFDAEAIDKQLDMLEHRRRWSEPEDEFETDMVKRLEELGRTCQLAGDHARAGLFFRKVLERVERPGVSIPHDTTPTKIKLAFTCLCQASWAEAESILIPMAWESAVADLSVYTGLHMLAMHYLLNKDYESCERLCKRALWGYRKIYGKDHSTCWEALELLAVTCDLQENREEAMAYRSFIPQSFTPVMRNDPMKYMEILAAAFRINPYLYPDDHTISKDWQKRL
ncbi:hypothetical protein B0T21DRAFT_377366 [Apiosordaria backusii]|uniref:Azaphilone pigments biosynthesis cluster protein L N-terminal domain-containing protein n=1 Tax=Apiosordaria backusii TaxID=314023 RepID=A0AA40A0R6_9PEZI|nr:hypothetical protein B0T21DRAFT_377366 [Apiosordaria backusii]